MAKKKPNNAATQLLDKLNANSVDRDGLKNELDTIRSTIASLLATPQQFARQFLTKEIGETPVVGKEITKLAQTLLSDYKQFVDKFNTIEKSYTQIINDAAMDDIDWMSNSINIAEKYRQLTEEYQITIAPMMAQISELIDSIETAKE